MNERTYDRTGREEPGFRGAPPVAMMRFGPESPLNLRVGTAQRRPRSSRCGPNPSSIRTPEALLETHSRGPALDPQ